MPRRGGDGVRALFAAIALLVVLVAAALWFHPGRALRVATGTTAHDLCSETFVSGLDPRRTFAESLAPRPGYRLVARGCASTSIATGTRFEPRFWAPSRAARCSDRAGARACLWRRAASRPAAGAAARAASAPAEAAEPALAEASDPRLKAALDAAFAEPEQAPHRWTKAIVVVHEGRIVAERYAPGYGVDTPILGFSMDKSVTNALVGILVRQGRLAVLAAPAPIAAWQAPGDPRAAITIEEPMRMTSGLDLDENGSGFDPSNIMLYTEPDMAGYAEGARLIAVPGRRWSYSSASTQILARIVRDAVGGSGEAVQRFAAKSCSSRSACAT